MVNSVARAVEILFFVSRSKHGSTLSDISAQLDIPKSTAFSIIRTLADKNLLTVTDARRLTVVLGPGIYELAFNEISGSGIYSIVQPELFALSAELKKTTAFYLFSGDSYSMLSINPYPGTPYPNVTIGQSIDVRSGQYGPVCLSAFEYEKICEITRTMSGDDAKRLHARVEQTRERGYDLFTCDRTNELYSLAVPVQGALRACFGFIAVYMLNPNVASDGFRSMVQCVQAVSSRIGNKAAFLP